MDDSDPHSLAIVALGKAPTTFHPVKIVATPMSEPKRTEGWLAASAVLSSFREHVNATAAAYWAAHRALTLRAKGDAPGAVRADEDARRWLRRAIEIEQRRPRAANDSTC